MWYRGGLGQWSYILHRVTGVGVLLFLLIHIVDTSLIGWGPEIYNKVIAIYRNPFFKVAEVGLLASVLFHALNGIRVLLVDFWPKGTLYHKQMFYGVVALFFLIMIPATYVMLSRL